LLVIPSVDILGGKCVKLVQGRPGTGLAFFQSPMEVALRWEGEGAERLHVVDLDGAMTGRRLNADVVKAISDRVGIPIEVGGGVRRVEDVVSLLNLGVEYVILGTSVVENMSFLDEIADLVPLNKLIVSVDSREGKIVSRGWKRALPLSPLELAEELSRHGLAGLLYTDVSSEGTMGGIDPVYIRSLVERSESPILYSGGISSLEDVKVLAGVGVSGVVVGSALYKGVFSLKEAIEAGKTSR
jgi:phosphoribosylformimino-5-aminoimidazole carboxamide ribotide isomerase